MAGFTCPSTSWASRGLNRYKRNPHATTARDMSTSTLAARLAHRSETARATSPISIHDTILCVMVMAP